LIVVTTGRLLALVPTGPFRFLSPHDKFNRCGHRSNFSSNTEWERWGWERGRRELEKDDDDDEEDDDHVRAAIVLFQFSTSYSFHTRLTRGLGKGGGVVTQSTSLITP